MTKREILVAFRDLAYDFDADAGSACVASCGSTVPETVAQLKGEWRAYTDACDRVEALYREIVSKLYGNQEGGDDA